MDGVKIGDVVKGIGWKRVEPCIMQVDKIFCFPGSRDLMKIEGIVINDEGRLTRMTEIIGRYNQRNETDPVIDLGFNMPKRRLGGWEILHGFEIVGPRTPLATRIKALEVGESIEVMAEDNPLVSVRSTAAIAGRHLGRFYQVEGTYDGAKVTRLAERKGPYVSPHGTPRMTMAYRIRSMDVGDEMAISSDKSKPHTVRCTASQIGATEGRKYKVAKTDDGVTVTRLS